MKTSVLYPPPMVMPAECPGLSESIQARLAMIGKALDWFFNDPTVELEEHLIDAAVHPRGVRDAVLVIDASGSMVDRDWPPSRLEAAKTAARSFCERLSVDMTP